jgi:hypothetical protein
MSDLLLEPPPDPIQPLRRSLHPQTLHQVLVRVPVRQGHYEVI